MKNIRVLLSLLIVALLAVGFVTGCGSSSDGDDGGTDTGSVSGTVTDNNGTPVSGATATITTTNTKEAVYPNSDTTDVYGDFLITNIPVGSALLTISRSGYQTINVTVTVTSGQDYPVPTNETVITPSTGVGSVAGTVSDATSAVAIEGAVVTIGTFSDTSDATGAYLLSGITAGTQTVTATKTGYENYTSTVTVVADTTVPKNIAMTSSAPEPGKGHVTGKVIDENGNALSGVTVTSGTTTTTTDSNGEYTLMNLNPGVVTISFAKTSYDSTTLSVTVVADQTVPANTVTMTQGIATGTTVLCSKPYKTEFGAVTRGGTVSDNGAYVAFISGQQLRTYVITLGVHVYLYDRSSGTVTVLDMNPDGTSEGTFTGLAATATSAFISGDGSRIAYATNADNLLGPGADNNGTDDIFVCDRATGKNSRISSDFSNPLKDAMRDTTVVVNLGATSANPGLSQDGKYCVFDSNAYNLVSSSLMTDVNVAGHVTTNVYKVTLTAGTAGAVTVSGQRLISGRQDDGLECNPADWGGVGNERVSVNPYISRDGKYVVYESNAFNDSGWAPANLFVGAANHSLLNDGVDLYRAANLDRDIVRCDTTLDVKNWTAFVSKNASGVIKSAGSDPCTNPTISDDGSKIAFQCVDNTAPLWIAGNDANMDVWLKNMSSQALSRVSSVGTGTRGNSYDPMISRDGTLVAFASGGTGFVQNDTNASDDIFVYGVADGSFERVNLNNNDEQTEATGIGGSIEPFLSGDNNYVAFTSNAKNLYTGEGSIYFLGGVPDIYLRKWK